MNSALPHSWQPGTSLVTRALSTSAYLLLRFSVSVSCLALYGRERAKRYADGRGQLSARTVCHCHSLLGEALGHGVKMGVVARSVALAVDPRSVRPL
jgi:hypothetical protein